MTVTWPVRGRPPERGEKPSDPKTHRENRRTEKQVASRTSNNAHSVLLIAEIFPSLLQSSDWDTKTCVILPYDRFRRLAEVLVKDILEEY